MSEAKDSCALNSVKQEEATAQGESIGPEERDSESAQQSEAIITTESSSNTSTPVEGDKSPAKNEGTSACELAVKGEQQTTDKDPLIEVAQVAAEVVEQAIEHHIDQLGKTSQTTGETMTDCEDTVKCDLGDKKSEKQEIIASEEAQEQDKQTSVDKRKGSQTASVGTSTMPIAETPEVSSTKNDDPPKSVRSSRRSSYQSSHRNSYGGYGYQNYGLNYLPYKSNFEPSEDARRKADEFFKTLKL